MKTADEMFRKIGYRRNKKFTKKLFVYENKACEILIYPGIKRVIKMIANVETSLLFDEILACAKLIEEMKGEQKDD